MVGRGPGSPSVVGDDDAVPCACPVPICRTVMRGGDGREGPDSDFQKVLAVEPAHVLSEIPLGRRQEPRIARSDRLNDSARGEGRREVRGTLNRVVARGVSSLHGRDW